MLWLKRLFIKVRQRIACFIAPLKSETRFTLERTALSAYSYLATVNELDGIDSDAISAWRRNLKRASVATCTDVLDYKYSLNEGQATRLLMSLQCLIALGTSGPCLKPDVVHSYIVLTKHIDATLSAVETAFDIQPKKELVLCSEN